MAHLRRQGGLAVVPSDAFAMGAAAALPDAVRASLGAAPDRDGLRDALRRIAAALQQREAAVSFSDVV